MPRSSIKRQREKILEVGKLMFMRLGYRRTTMSAIAQAARIGKATIYQHYPSKQELFGAIVREQARQLLRGVRREVDRAVGYRAKVETFFRARLRRLSEQQVEDQLSREVFLEMILRAEAVMKREFEQECEELARLLEEGHAAGELTVQRPREIAAAMIGALRALNLELIYRCRDGGAPQEVQQIIASVEALLEVIMRGMTPVDRLAD